MFKLYLASAFVAVGLFGYAQYRGWTLLPSEAEEFQRVRAAEQSSRRSGGSSGRSGGFSGK